VKYHLIPIRIAIIKKRANNRTSLVGQWLRFCSFNPGQGTRSHLPQVRASAEQITIVGKDVIDANCVDGNSTQLMGM